MNCDVDHKQERLRMPHSIENDDVIVDPRVTKLRPMRTMDVLCLRHKAGQGRPAWRNAQAGTVKRGGAP